MRGAINIPHDAEVTLDTFGRVSLRYADGQLVRYRLLRPGAWVVGPLTSYGRWLEMRR